MLAISNLSNFFPGITMPNNQQKAINRANPIKILSLFRRLINAPAINAFNNLKIPGIGHSLPILPALLKLHSILYNASSKCVER